MSKKVVVTGLGIIAPNGVGKDEYWKAVMAGDSGIKKLSRFNVEDYPVKIAGEVPDFRPQDYMDRREARHLSRFAQFALAATNMAVSDSNLKMEKENPYRIGISLGNTLGGKEIEDDQHELFNLKGWKRLHPYLAAVVNSNFAVGVLASKYGISGPNCTFSTGCTSGISAISYGYELIKNGIIDFAIVGGSEAPLVPYTFNAFCAARVLTKGNGNPKYASRPFDMKRDGYVLAEGCGIMIIESLKHAQKRKAKIYSEILGYGVTNDAYDFIKMEPTGTKAAMAMSIAIARSNIKPEDIDCINAHGSSSKLSDKRETNAIKKVFGSYAYKIPISSVKSMIGQPLAASGSIQVITGSLALKNNYIPPTINYDEPDPECDLDYTPNKCRKINIQNVLINSFGLGGNNISMVLGSCN